MKGGAGGELPRLVATLGGIGRAPLAPGTAASLLAVAAYCALWGMGRHLPALFVLLLAPLAVWASGRYEAAAHRRDPPEIVVDEWVGQFVCLLGTEPTPGALAAGFFLFRVLDVIKPPPLRRLERLPGGVGVVADDVGAGVLGWAVLRGLSHFGVV